MKDQDHLVLSDREREIFNQLAAPILERLSALENLVNPPQDIKKEIWDLGATMFHMEPARWRSLVGKLIKTCGDERALEVLRAADNLQTMDPMSYLGAAIAQGEKGPVWKMTDDELVEEAARLGLSTINTSRQELQNLVQAAQQRQRKHGTTCQGFGADAIGT